jgi:hypothetical protein
VSATAQLRVVVTGLTAFAAAAEETLLTSAASDSADRGNERRWAAVPTIAHNADPDLKPLRLSGRLTAILAG